MAIDFNESEKQGAGGPIPADSCVALRIHLRRDPSKKESNLHPLLTQPRDGGANHYLDCEFEVVHGTYKGNKLWQNMVVTGSPQATAISMRTFRAIVESARKIDPDDVSAPAIKARVLDDWKDLDLMVFAAKVGIEKPAAGDKYLNNYIKRVLVPGDTNYDAVMAGGELISDTPLPERPIEETPPSWGQGREAPSATGTGAGGSGAQRPSWAK